MKSGIKRKLSINEININANDNLDERSFKKRDLLEKQFDLTALQSALTFTSKEDNASYSLENSNPSLYLLRNYYNRTWLEEAILREMPIKTIRFLLEKNRSVVNMKNENGETPLFLTIYKRNSKVALMLVDEYDADTYVVNNRNQTLNDIAIQHKFSSFSNFVNSKSLFPPIHWMMKAPSFIFSNLSLSTITPPTLTSSDCDESINELKSRTLQFKF